MSSAQGVTLLAVALATAGANFFLRNRSSSSASSSENLAEERRLEEPNNVVVHEAGNNSDRVDDGKGTCTPSERTEKLEVEAHCIPSNGSSNKKLTSIDDNMIKCASCGKYGDELKTCNACRLVRYCGVHCQRAHRLQHKKECRMRAAELHDEVLFKQPPRQDECPICFLELPLGADMGTYKSCCGQIICDGCLWALEEQCPFCREPTPCDDEEKRKRTERRVELNDPHAMFIMGRSYAVGRMGLEQDMGKAIEFLRKASELGSTDAHQSLGGMYLHGYGVQADNKKAKHHYEKAAIEGHVQARHDIGVMENGEGNLHRAMKHFMISASAGNKDSLNSVQGGYRVGLVTKDDFEKTLRAHKESQDELESEWRDKAAEFELIRNLIIGD